MKKLVLFLFVLAFFSIETRAQQEAHYTHFMYNKLMLNPAYAGGKSVPFVTAVHRSQWLGWDGAPTSQLVSFNSPFLRDRVGIGATISHLKIGLQRDVFAQLAYSYDLVAKDGISLRAGLHGSIRSFSTNFGDPMDLNLASPTDESIQQGTVRNSLGNVGAGVYGSYKDQFYAGFSIPNIVANELNTDNIIAEPDSLALRSRHFYAMGGLGLRVSDQVRFLPQILIKYVPNAPLDADLNGTLEFNKKAGIGLSLRYGGDTNGIESADLLVFFKVKEQFTFGISYDFTLSQIKDYSSGSVEAMISMDLKRTKNEMSNPRFFF